MSDPVALVLWYLTARHRRVCVHCNVTEFIHAANTALPCLDEMLQVRVLRETSEVLARIHCAQLWNTLLEEGQTSRWAFVSVSVRWWAKDQSLGLWGRQSMIKSLLAVFFIKSHDRDAGLNSAHLSDKTLRRESLVTVEDKFVTWSETSLKQAECKCRAISLLSRTWVRFTIHYPKLDHEHLHRALSKSSWYFTNQHAHSRNLAWQPQQLCMHQRQYLRGTWGWFLSLSGITRHLDW